MVDRVEAADVEQEVDVGEPLARPIERVGEVGAVHDRVWHAVAAAHHATQLEAHDRQV